MAADRVSIQEVLRKVVATDPQIAMRQASLNAAEAERRASEAVLYPSVDLSTQAGRAARNDVGGAASSSADDGLSRPGRSTSLTVSQLLFDAGKSSAQVQISQLRADRERIALRKTIDERVLVALQASLDLAAQRSKLDQVKAVEGRLERLVSIVEGRLRSGQAPLVELRRAQSRLLDQRRAVAEASGLRRQAEQRFLLVTGVAGTDLELGSMPARQLDPREIGKLRAACQKQCLDVADAELAVEAARREVDATTSAFLPKVVLQASAAHNMNSTGAPDHYSSRNVWVVATWNLYSGGGDLARRRSAHERVAAGEAQTQAVVQQATGDFDKLEQEYLTAIEVERLARSAAEVAADTRSLAERGYEAGVRPLLDVADTLVEEARAQANVIDAGTQKAFAQYRLLTLVGDLAARMGAVAES
ncbi:TolC family protein [Variovorax sp. JS1663]|uniref:TolC family protein n=1 Tax=Variovorax sp. JS1663 TaxID=1851577 RepID=UPI0013022DF7|nr:TolC family protein [Variovorax sp. JS1663]